MLNINQIRLLVALAQANGSKYSTTWYGDSWENVLGSGPMIQKYTCFICGHDIVNEQYHQYQQYIWNTAITEHGIQHLQGSKLLAFL